MPLRQAGRRSQSGNLGTKRNTGRREVFCAWPQRPKHGVDGMYRWAWQAKVAVFLARPMRQINPVPTSDGVSINKVAASRAVRMDCFFYGPIPVSPRPNYPVQSDRRQKRIKVHDNYESISGRRVTVAVFDSRIGESKSRTVYDQWLWFD